MVMPKIEYDPEFIKGYSKIKDNSLKTRIEKQIEKIMQNPEIGKPMMYSRKGTREVYVPPFRLSYSYSEKDNTLFFIDMYHKDEQ
jgi:mRNA-degrading endonuclease RelE of RelBE toxin-antitoxin system